MIKTRQYSLSEIESFELVASYEAEAEFVDALHDRLRETAVTVKAPLTNRPKAVIL